MLRAQLLTILKSYDVYKRFETKPEIDTSTFATKQELENKVERAEIEQIFK